MTDNTWNQIFYRFLFSKSAMFSSFKFVFYLVCFDFLAKDVRILSVIDSTEVSLFEVDSAHYERHLCTKKPVDFPPKSTDQREPSAHSIHYTAYYYLSIV
jgi:hypothetical protein